MKRTMIALLVMAFVMPVNADPTDNEAKCTAGVDVSGVPRLEATPQFLEADPGTEACIQDPICRDANCEGADERFDAFTDIVCSDHWDHADEDADGMTNCLETALGTIYDERDSDQDGIWDGVDLAPHDPVEDVAVQVDIALLEEGGTRCDTWDGKVWDPYFETAFLEIPTWDPDGSRKAKLTRTGFTHGNHPHETKSLTPENLGASIELPSEVSLYRLDNFFDLPFIDLRLGLYDHDGWQYADAVDIGAKTGLPISLSPDGSNFKVTLEGTAKCRAVIEVEIQTPITWEDAYVSPIADALSGSGEGGAASLKDLRKQMDRLAALGRDSEYTDWWIEATGAVAHANVAMAAAQEEWNATFQMDWEGHLAAFDPTDHGIPLEKEQEPESQQAASPGCVQVSGWNMEGYRPTQDSVLVTRLVSDANATLAESHLRVSAGFAQGAPIAVPITELCTSAAGVAWEFQNATGDVLFSGHTWFPEATPQSPNTLYYELHGQHATFDWSP